MNSSRFFGLMLGLMVLVAVPPSSVYAAACLSNPMAVVRGVILLPG